MPVLEFYSDIFSCVIFTADWSQLMVPKLLLFIHLNQLSYAYVCRLLEMCLIC